MSIYSEEYETATPLIASLLWSLPAKCRPNEGLINVELFISLGDQLQEAATVDAGSDEERFLELQETLRNAIQEFRWPEDWNIELEQFTEYCEALQRMDGNYPESQDGQQVSSNGTPEDYESEVSDLDELFDENVSNWQSAVPLDDIRREAEKAYGIPFISGPVLGWSGDDRSGYSQIIGNQYHGKKIARVIQSMTLPTHVDDNMSVELNSRAQQILNDEINYDSRLVEGIGLVAWKVDPKHELDPTLSLHPGKVTSYPETYVWVQWFDGVWTWESRSGFKCIMHELTNFQVDLLLYRLATSQDGDYRESLTGQRPSYLVVSPSDLQGRDIPTGGDLESSRMRTRNSREGRRIKKPNPFLDEVLPSPERESNTKVQSKQISKLLSPNLRNGRSNKITLPQSQVSPGSRYTTSREQTKLLGIVQDQPRRSASRRVGWEDDQ
ncbi:hypothetical protein EYZ11_012848 [Aspergillus tanneri]|uniref:Uncharacterized protein n=1 Tax=Aspergillus tanneri TaxID=1220188 RepID=A0A4S3J1B8_9EURO|nr:hypothetical protein EYZ11_012848 [Aspergillus tanneri]